MVDIGVSDSVRAALKGGYDQHGKQLIDEPKRCESLLRDRCPSNKLEIAALIAAAKERVPHKLLALPAASLTTVTLSNLVASLCANTGLAADVARWSVETWAYALGLDISASKSGQGKPFGAQVVQEVVQHPGTGVEASQKAKIAQRIVYAPSAGAGIGLIIRRVIAAGLACWAVVIFYYLFSTAQPGTSGAPWAIPIGMLAIAGALWRGRIE
jgi:hypothetical protein